MGLVEPQYSASIYSVMLPIDSLLATIIQPALAAFAIPFMIFALIGLA
jgi:hypothetical protein